MSSYIQRAKRVIEQAEAKADRYKGDCSSCKWSRWALDRQCANPVVQLAAFNAQQGYHRNRTKECDYQRGTTPVWGSIVCGPDGELYEPGFFARLFR